jgi:hypothetical protein
MKKILLIGLLAASPAMAQQPYDNCAVGYTLQQVDYKIFDCVPMQQYYQPRYVPQVYINPIVQFGRYFSGERYEDHEGHEHRHRDRD